MNNNEVILVTGGTGFAGSHLIEALLKSGYTNVHTTSFSDSSSYIKELLGEDKLHQLDLTNTQATKQLISELQPTQIYHLASFAFVGKSFAEPRKLLSNNSNLQLNVLEAVKELVPQTRVLVVGSAEEYGVSLSEAEIPYTEQHQFRPINPYAVSKVTQDMLSFAYATSFNLDIVRVRPFNHIGERQSTDFALPAFASQIVAIEKGKQDVLKVGSLTAIRDFTDVKDVVKAYILIMNKGESGEVYNIGSGRGVVMADVVKQLISLSKVAVKLVEDPTRFRPHDIPKMIADNQKVRALGWQPEISLTTSLKRVLEYARLVY